MVDFQLTQFSDAGYPFIILCDAEYFENLLMTYELRINLGIICSIFLARQIFSDSPIKTMCYFNSCGFLRNPGRPSTRFVDLESVDSRSLK